MSLRFLTAGETHGPQLTTIIEGLPSNMKIDFDALNFQLHRRQKGYGRGRRMQIEKDTAQILGGCATDIRPARRLRLSWRTRTGRTGETS